MKYTIVESFGNNFLDAASDLEELVRIRILDGWRPLGGLSVCCAADDLIVAAQAMTREEA